MATRYYFQGLVLIIIFILIKTSVTASFNINNNKKQLNTNNLFIISFDGFRYDYINSSATPNIFNLRKKGSWSEAMLNVFPTKTFTNHFSMVTGMYPGSHGVLDSTVRENGNLIKYSEVLFKSNRSSIPIWVQAEKAGIKSMVMYWTGSDIAYEGILPTSHLDYKTNTRTWSESVDLGLKFLSSDVNPRLVMLYLNEPDFDAHAFGSDSLQVREWISKADNFIGTLVKKVNSKNTNVIIVSDHGMDTVTFERVINLDKIISNTIYDTAGTSPCLQIFPKNGKYDEVLNALKNEERHNNKFRVFKKSEIPLDWNYANSLRAPPILALNAPGYGFQDFCNVEGYKKQYNLPDDHIWSLGSHGYHPLENMKMLAVFFAWGPDIRQNHKLPPISKDLPQIIGARTIDLYGLWCNMLELQCPPRDGSMNELYDKVILKYPKTSKRSSSGEYHTISSLSLVFSCITSMLLIY